MKKYARNTLFMVFYTLGIALFMGCGPRGPLVTECTPNPTSKNFKCFNEANGVSSDVEPGKLDNWLFVSAADERSILTACENSTGWPKITVCPFDPAEMKFVCISEVTGKSSSISFSDSEKFGLIGVSSVDEQILLEFCADRSKKAHE